VLVLRSVFPKCSFIYIDVFHSVAQM